MFQDLADDLALPSLDDEKRSFGDLDAHAVADRYRGWGAQTVVIKDGVAPALLVDADDAIFIAPQLIQ